MNYFFLIYSLLLVLSSLIPIFPKNSSYHMFFMDIKPSVQNFLHIPMFIFWVIFLNNPRFNIKTLLINEKRKILFFGFLFGVLLEVIQIPVPGRYGSLEDILFNLLGLTIGCVCVSKFFDNKSL